MRGKLKIWLVFVAIFYSIIPAALGQYVKIGDGSYAGTLGGPMVASTTKDTQVSRFAYIFPKAELANLYHKDTIISCEFFHVASLAAPNSSTLCKIWIQNTSRSDFGAGKLHFPTETKNSTLVFSNTPSSYIGALEKFYKIPFSTSRYVYDSLNGENLAIFVEYQQIKKQTSTLQWYFESPTTVTSYAANQVKYGISTTGFDSLPNSASYHPTIILNFPKFQKDIAIIKVYSLGKLPIPLGKPDSVKVLLRNVGKQTLSNYYVYTRSQGFNTQKDSFKVSIDPGDQGFFTVPSLNPVNAGLDSVFVESHDPNNYNNSGESFRLGNANVYSYRDVTQSPAPGGIGFNGTNGDFVAKFFSNSPKNMNQITVTFGSGGQPFKVGIWSHDSTRRRPGKLIYQSDSLTSKSGNYILDLKKPVQIKGSFYVGVRQLGTNNISFGYQMENPVRPRTFFYAEPLGDTNWVDFSPDAPYKFLIEPRLQADIDIAAISADYPKDSINAYTVDSLAPEGVVGNIGLQNATDSFNIRCEIWFGNTKLYNKTIRDTLSSGIKRKYTFPKRFIPTSFGEHVVMIIVKRPGDQVVDNNTATRKFYVGVKKDVMINTVYEPSNGGGYNYKIDTMMPMANIQNVGYDNSPTFTVRCRIFQRTKVVYNQTQLLSLPKFQSKILFWPTYKCSDTGKLQVVFTTEMLGDAYKKNDTQSRTIYVRKIIDIGVDSLRSPDINQFYTKGKPIGIKFKAYNDGLIPAFSVPFYCSIYEPTGKRVYYDSTKSYIQALYALDLSMTKNFTPTNQGLHKIVIRTKHYLDLFTDNDSLVKFFSVGKPYDFQAIQITNPKQGDVLSLEKPSISPKLLLKNNGYLNSTGPVTCEIYQNGNRIYYDVKNFTLDTFKSDTVVFAQSFRPMNVGTFNMICYSNLNSDLVKSNDTARISFSAVVGKDAYPFAATLSPDTNQFDLVDSLFSAAITVKNQGIDSIRKVLINISIFEGKTRTAYISKVTQLESKGVDTVIFDLQHKFSKVGITEIRIFTSSFEDQNIFNDSMVIPVAVNITRDLALLRAKQPGSNDKIVENDSMRFPKIQIANIGAGSTTQNTLIRYRIVQQPSKTIVFADTLVVSKITPLDTVWLNSLKGFKFSSPGAYVLEAFASISVDGNAKNDTLRYILLVDQKVDRETVFLHSVVAYPVPTHDHITINNALGYKTWNLYDMNGKMVSDGKVVSNQFDIDTQPFSSGLYVLKLQGEIGFKSMPIAIAHP
ncbi:MAG: T9SS type A sorting domain-containing protein [Bacteroidetes bacterium]|nr:T9SS type A sorting domain-containing protein [Bacteroidota bacterium]MDA1224649.1 T9SS type A sorting domain-containing protein [Bacteroidota bacterium]